MNTLRSSCIAALVLVGFGCGGESVETGEDALPIDDEASSKADGTVWRKVYSCNGGAAVLDVNDGERRNVQFVIRDPNVIRYFNEVGVVHSRYGATEIILSGWTGHMDWGRPEGPVAHGYPYAGRGIFWQGDFSEMFASFNNYDRNSRFARVFRDGPGIKVEFAEIALRGCARETTYYVGDGFGWVTSCEADYTEYVVRANWYFDRCD